MGILDLIIRLASSSRQAPANLKASKSSGEERRLSYDAVRRRHHTSEQDKLLVEEEDEADKADDEKDDEGNQLHFLFRIYGTEKNLIQRIYFCCKCMFSIE